MAQLIKPRLKTLASIELATTITKHTRKATMTPTTKALGAMAATTTKIRITVEAAEKINE